MSSAVRLSDMRPAITKQTMCSPVHSVLQCHSIYRGKGSVLAAAGSQSSGAWNVELPNGVFWLDRASHNHDVVYGQTFVLQRPKRGGEGLVLSNQVSGMQVMEAVTPPASPLARPASQCQEQGKSLPVLLAAAPMDFLDITDYVLVEEVDDEAEAGARPSVPARDEQLTSACTGIVVHSLFGGRQSDAEDDQTPQDRNPRRTRKVKFTCNLCGETTTKRVNPHAWANGTVFAECSGCHVKHKLIDNLKLFHELKGPVFPGPAIHPGLIIPSGLPQRPLMDFHQHPGLFSMFDPDTDAEQ